MNDGEVTKMTLNDITSLRDFLMEGLHASSNDEVEIQVAGKIPLSDPFMQEVLRSRKAEEDRDA
ncbi:MAG: hypothetical protein K0R67_2070 [Paenibacillus sp.]|jgi:hypothetical protein|nr:hypothetical protein [Paenibacillus sp.]